MASLFSKWKAAIERVVFAGLKPDAPAAQRPKKSKFGSLIDSAEDLASLGLKSEEKQLPGPTSWLRKLGIMIAVLLLGVFIYLLVTVLRHPAEQAEKDGPAPAPLEIVPKDFSVEKNRQVEVVAIDFVKNKEPKEIRGTVRNLTDREISKCEVSFDVTTKGGAQLGGVVTDVTGLAPHGSARFRIPVTYPGADFVIVREIRPE